MMPGYLSHTTITRSLDALAGQSFRDFEIIVVDSSPDDRTADAVRRFPDVQLIRSSVPLLPHQARNLGAGRARGHILVFTDPDCLAEASWLQRLVDLHREGWKATAGAVAPEPGTWNHAVHWVRHAWWMPGGETRPHPEGASANSSFSRDIWEQLGGYYTDRFAGDSELGWRARAQGYEIRFDPRAVVTHVHPISLRGLFRDRFTRGRDFGFTRSERNHWSRLRAFAYMAAAPAIPPAMTLRAAVHAAAGRRLLEWALYTPFQLLFHSVWCAGEWTALARYVARGGATTK